MAKAFKAIAAMSLNRVIGRNNQLPWHIPEELKWFKKMTTGHVIIMGRATWESIGRPLPNRETIVVSRKGTPIPGIQVVSSLDDIDPAHDSRDYFLTGGAQLFQAGLPRCSDLYLTLVKREVQGDIFFPPFESEFDLAETISDTAEFKILHYRRKDSPA